MKFYTDVVAAERDEQDGERYHYHRWSDQSIRTFWEVATSNPFLRRQFYPLAYWRDLIAWASRQISGVPGDVLDIGCGGGNLIQCIREVFPSSAIVGVDLTEASLEPVRQRFAKDGRLEVRVGELTAIPALDESLDLVTCTEVLEHTFPDVFHGSFAEIRRVLRPGGHYLATLPLAERVSFVCCPECRSVFTPHQHMVFEISPPELERLLTANGFELVGFYRAVDHRPPNGTGKRLLKKAIIRHAPALASRLFPKAGTTGFLARRQ